MNSNRIQDWLQIVGMFGVIASLVFVGLEMRQTKDIAISAGYQEGFVSEEQWQSNLDDIQFIDPIQPYGQTYGVSKVGMYRPSLSKG